MQALGGCQLPFPASWGTQLEIQSLGGEEQPTASYVGHDPTSWPNTRMQGKEEERQKECSTCMFKEWPQNLQVLIAWW